MKIAEPCCNKKMKPSKRTGYDQQLEFMANGRHNCEKYFTCKRFETSTCKFDENNITIYI